MTTLPIDKSVRAARPLKSVSPAQDHALLCSHCGQPVPPSLRSEDHAEQFCCQGCQAVHHAIVSCGLEQYHALRKVADTSHQRRRTPPSATDRSFEEFDDPAFRARYCTGDAAHLQSIELALEGVHCAACVWLVEKLPIVLPGVMEARLNLGRKRVRLQWDNSAIPLSRIARQLAQFGYTPHALTERMTEQLRRCEDRAFLIAIAVAGALAGNVMLLSFALYGGMFHGMEAEFYHFFRWISFGLALLSMAWPGRVFFLGALNAMRSGVVNMDVPIATGLAAGMLWSTAATIVGTGEVYFDSMTTLVLLLLTGRWIQLRRQRTCSDAMELLFSMTPRRARRIDEASERDVPIDALKPGHRVLVRAGETIPVDGIVTDGRSAMSVAWLTGESRRVLVRPGDRVHAGSLNTLDQLVVEVESTGEATRAGRLMQLVAECAQRRAPIVRLADRLAGRFVVIVLALAAVTLLAWWHADPARAIEHAIALLVITCPCALGLATPLAIVAGIGKAARRGILIKGGDAVQALTRRGGTIFLDKTGTITEGSISVRDWQGDETLKPVVAAIERHASHPVAVALANISDHSIASRVPVQDVRSLPNGIMASANGAVVAIGSRACMDSLGVTMPAWATASEQRMIEAARSPVFVAVDGELRAMASVGDTIRSDSASAIAALKKLGWRVAILSGDHPAVVRSVAASVGVDAEACVGGVTPEQKLAIVEASARHGTTIMVGDGVNDAAALAAATVGVAVHGGAEASLASADVYLNREGLTGLPELIVGSARTLGVIRRGLVLSLSYNVLGSALAMAGMINPLAAAILMPISSLSVITLAFRSRTFGGAPCR